MTTQLGSIVKTSTIDTVAKLLGRYGLVVVIGWIGLLKFANYEAHQIQPLVANSPFMGWLLRRAGASNEPPVHHHRRGR
jgi:uncharacterized membrane protein YkgB